MTMIWPVPGHYEIRSGFTERRWYGQHDAIDILCPVGARVVAIAPGQVIFAGNAGDCGIGVWLAHDDGARSHHCHLEPVGVVSLGHVEAGATIGYVGMTGVTRVPHLHLNLFMQQRPAGVLSDWIAWVGMWAVDPEHYLTPEEEDDMKLLFYRYKNGSIYCIRPDGKRRAISLGEALAHKEAGAEWIQLKSNDPAKIAKA